MVYLPGASTSPAYVMKSARADQLAPEVRAIIRELIPNSPMYRIFTMEGLAANAMASLSFTMVMVSIAAVLALVLGAVGLYAVLSYGVAQRTREIGVRMALGAEAKTVRRMFVWQGTRVALLGVVVGALAAVALTRYIQTLLFGVGRLDVDGVRRHVCRDARGGAARELHTGATRLARRSSRCTAQRIIHQEKP